MNITTNIDLQSLPDVSGEDLAQLIDMIPELLKEGSMNMAVRLAPDRHEIITVSLKPEHCPIDRPGGFAQAHQLWVWEQRQQRWYALDLSRVVMAESAEDPDDLVKDR